MEESKRQKQVAGVIQEEMNDIFLRMGLNMINGGMVSIAAVKVTPDLLEARFYLSLFQVKDAEAVLAKQVHNRNPENLVKDLRPHIRAPWRTFW